MRHPARSLSDQTGGVPARELIIGVERTWARDAGQLAHAIADLDPSWGTQVFPVGDGLAVLCGPGLYVNKVLALGLDEDPTDTDLDLVERQSSRLGVPASIEVCDATRDGLREMLDRRSYRHDGVTAAAARVDTPGLMVARSSDDGRILGCATLKIDGEIATLGGMSTLPAERG